MSPNGWCRVSAVSRPIGDIVDEYSQDELVSIHTPHDGPRTTQRRMGPTTIWRGCSRRWAQNARASTGISWTRKWGCRRADAVPAGSRCGGQLSSPRTVWASDPNTGKIGS